MGCFQDSYLTGNYSVEARESTFHQTELSHYDNILILSELGISDEFLKNFLPLYYYRGKEENFALDTQPKIVKIILTIARPIGVKMKLNQSQKNIVYELIAIATRPSEIVRRINEQFKPSKPFAKEQVSYYLKVFRNLTPEEQIKHLPYTKQPSFAIQETRINDDISDLIRLNEDLDRGEGDTIEIVRAKISIKNRIAQELGQALAYSKAGVGNLTIMQNIFNQYRGFIEGAKGLPQEDVVDLLDKLDEVKNGNKPSS